MLFRSDWFLPENKIIGDLIILSVAAKNIKPIKEAKIHGMTLRVIVPALKSDVRYYGLMLRI